ncbi:hypothetical protein ACQJBY_070315 [Aegilops geniculata]
MPPFSDMAPLLHIEPNPIQIHTCLLLVSISLELPGVSHSWSFMSNSSSSTVREEILPLIPCPDCGDRLMTWIARRGANAGYRFYTCVNREVGLCGFIIVILALISSHSKQLISRHSPCIVELVSRTQIRT